MQNPYRNTTASRYRQGLVLVSCLAILLSGCKKTEEVAQPEVSVQAAKVERKSLTAYVSGETVLVPQTQAAIVPKISAPIKLKELGRVGAGPHIVLAESEMKIGLRDVLPPSATGVVLAVGPEGGWADEELRWFQQSGWTTASIGNTILRAETAAIVAAALAVEILS